MGKTTKDKGEDKLDKSGNFNISMILIIISAIIIGFLSPSGIFKCAFTFGVFYIFLNFHSIIHPIVTPIFNFIHAIYFHSLANVQCLGKNIFQTVQHMLLNYLL